MILLLRTLLNKKNRLFNNYKKHGYEIEDKNRLDTFRIECHLAVENAELTYLENLGNNVNDPSNSQKSYWKFLNRVVIKCRASKIPHVNNMFLLNCCEKAKLFNDFISKQCTLIINSSVLSPLNLLTDKNIDNISLNLLKFVQ